jgi:hypothetical protein
MSTRVRVLRGMAIWRVVTTQRRVARLTRPQMDPLRADLYALFALPPLRMLDARNRVDMGAGFVSHNPLLYLALHKESLNIPFLPLSASGEGDGGRGCLRETPPLTPPRLRGGAYKRLNGCFCAKPSTR